MLTQDQVIIFTLIEQAMVRMQNTTQVQPVIQSVGEHGLWLSVDKSVGEYFPYLGIECIAKIPDSIEQLSKVFITRLIK